mmetsp:Transcript_38492/g.89068  ORF Transcript_38492/g.89068 Transcript_38492/m.89068 type:complete len:116 (+) Transcript_38492:955-1302(+)
MDSNVARVLPLVMLMDPDSSSRYDGLTYQLCPLKGFVPGGNMGLGDGDGVGLGVGDGVGEGVGVGVGAGVGVGVGDGVGDGEGVGEVPPMLPQLPGSVKTETSPMSALSANIAIW